ncbi:thiamine phosphate synthase [Magnetospirillum sulfuroxidans]|uniref:Thiamine phosphate synthase n=1 Tax=Magnetospirillum sulfuroxidans TaxID=611300 RepID=A0ABS5IEC0_9PROT|nr:thiamine phosphate synthase [Magnetospirillum sulfuroxidans]MBR9972760.1 thiamine phosphate synthase [Magnetospirillum sulfuroxidans]
MTLAEPISRLNSSAGRIPRLFLLTDDHRLPDPLPAISRLPVGSGVIFRHYDDPRRCGLARQVARLCRQRRLCLLVANDWRLAARIGADGIYLAEGLARSGRASPCRLWLKRRGGILGMAAHSPVAVAWAKTMMADFCVLSQVFASGSHPGQSGIGPLRFALWARQHDIAVIALGGLNRQSWRRIPPGCAHGWAAISGLSR